MDIFKVMVIGAGTMGAEIALSCSLAGARVRLIDLNEAICNNAIERMLNNYSLDTFRIAAINRILVGSIERDLRQAINMDWVIEAVPESYQIKIELLAKLDEFNSAIPIISTNTSGISIERLARNRSAAFQESFLGTHFFNPASIMGLVEVIPSRYTSKEVVSSIGKFISSGLSKKWVLSQDVPNFIVNNFAFQTNMRAIEQVLLFDFTVEQADALSGRAIGRPKTAIFGLIDLIGTDVWLKVCDNMGNAARRYRRAYELIERMVDHGLLGRKVGKGFYKIERSEDGAKNMYVLDLNTFTYRSAKRIENVEGPEDIHTRLQAVYNNDQTEPTTRFQRELINAAIRIAKRLVPNVASNNEDLDISVRLGLGHEIGPFEIAELLKIK